MSNEKLEIKATIQIQKPVQEVFEAIVDPSKMSNYFIADGSGRMEQDTQVIWHFPEFTVDVPVRVGKIEKDKYISFSWDGEGGKELLVEIILTSKGATDTLISVTEKEMENNEAGIKWLKSNTEGWANFLACLKAYLEYEINLRKGAFDFMKNQPPVAHK
jgi:uncharacterized protein YndB with AHSA1/START domain